MNVQVSKSASLNLDKKINIH